MTEQNMASLSLNTTRVRIDIFQAPPLPRYYVERPEYSQNLKAHLLASSKARLLASLKARLLANSSDTQAIVMTAIHGFSAVGKSTLATALAYDNDVQFRFNDGILWVTLGQEPKILPMLSGWVQALGDYNFKPTTVEATANHLRTLLDDKAVLLVVDDAWSPDDAQIFNLGGSRCQVLVTTREKAIADVLEAETYSLDVMTLSQSMELLTQSLGREITAEEAKPAEALAKELGYLPLALELAVAQVADGMSWEVLLGDIQREIVQLQTLDREGAEDITDEANLKRLSLTASLHLSLKQLPPETRENFIWLGILPDDVQITSRMTAILWELDEEDARDKLAYLRSKALLLDGVVLADGKPTYRLHDLFHDLARYLLSAPIDGGSLSGLGISLTEAHGILLEKYRRLTENNLWHTLPNDGYIHRHLVWHLEKAGKIDEIHGLLAEESKNGFNGWYEACEYWGKTGIFINNVAQAWKLAEVDSDEERLPEAIGLQCRYALITASMNSLPANLPVNLLVALVKNNVWSPEQGLAYTLQKSHPLDRVKFFEKLVDYLPANLQKLAISAVAREIQSQKDRAYFLIAWANKFPEILSEALAVARQIQSESLRAQVLSDLANKFSELLPETLATVQQLQSQKDRAYFLIALANKFPEILPEALDMTRQIQDEEDRARVFSDLANKFPEILPEALDVTRKIHSEEYRTQILKALADKLTPELLPEALDVTQQIQDEKERTQILKALAHKLTPELLPEALSVAQQIQNEKDRAEVLSALAHKLTPELLPEALSVAQQIQDDRDRAEVLSALCDRFPEILPEAMAAVKDIEGEDLTEALISLADKLTPEVLPEALAIVGQIEKESERVTAIAALADKLTPEIFPQALTLARKMQSEDDRSNFFSALAGKLLQMPKTQLYPLWQSNLHALSFGIRPGLLLDIKGLTPVIFSLGGEEAIKNTVLAIKDVCRWWR